MHPHLAIWPWLILLSGVAWWTVVSLKERPFWKWELLLLLSNEYPFEEVKQLNGKPDYKKGVELQIAYLGSYWMSGRGRVYRPQPPSGIFGELKQLRIRYAEAVYYSQYTLLKSKLDEAAQRRAIEDH